MWNVDRGLDWIGYQALDFCSVVRGMRGMRGCVERGSWIVDRGSWIVDRIRLVLDCEMPGFDLSLASRAAQFDRNAT
jgi:hypothetical protein